MRKGKAETGGKGQRWENVWLVVPSMNWETCEGRRR